MPRQSKGEFKMTNLKKTIDRLFDAIVDEEKDEIKAILHELKDDLGKPCTVYQPLNAGDNGYELGDLKTRVEDELYNISVYEFNRKPIKNLDYTRYVLSSNLASLIIYRAEIATDNKKVLNLLKEEIKAMNVQLQKVNIIDLRVLIDLYGDFLPKFKDDYVLTEYSKEKLEDLLETLNDDEELFEMKAKDKTNIELINLNNGETERTEFSKDFIKELAKALEDDDDLEYVLNELAEKYEK